MGARSTVAGILLFAGMWLGCTGKAAHSEAASFEEARAAAAAAGTLLLVDFYTDW